MKKSLLTKKLANGRALELVPSTGKKIFVPFTYESYQNNIFTIGQCRFKVEKNRGREYVIALDDPPASWFIDLSADIAA